MFDYSIMFDNPDMFFQTYLKNPRIINFNERREDLNGGTILHLIVKKLFVDQENRTYGDEEALRLAVFMHERNACLHMEDYDSRIPYELFNLFTEDPFQYKTYSYLLANSCNDLLQGKCKREFIQEHKPVVYYDFDRAYV